MKNLKQILLTTFIAPFSASSFAQGEPKRIEAESYEAIHIAMARMVTEEPLSANSARGDGYSTKMLILESDQMKGKLNVETGKWKLGEQTLKINNTKGKQTLTLVSPK